jgi:type IV pilus assembly protein PilB
MSAGKLGELLISQGVINDEQLRIALEYRTQRKTRLGTALIELGHINEKVLATFLSKQYGISAISLDDVEVPTDLTRLIPRSLCERHLLVPLNIDSSRLSIAVSDPTNVSAVDDVRFLCNMDVNVYVATESAIQRLIEKAYGGGESEEAANESQDLGNVLSREENGDMSEGGTQAIEIDRGFAAQAQDLDQDTRDEKPIIRLINKLFVEASKRKVSDIHIEPFETFSRVRFRIDGSLHEIMRAPQQFRMALPARLKVMAQLDISEKRLPQDGRLQLRLKTKKIDVRVSTLPTIFGEKVVMRLLDQSETKPDLVAMGLEEEQLKQLRLAATQPYGMILVTGPTGSGKSTTLYAVLSELNLPDVNISTVEDPVEYHMDGINQIQMKDSIGLNFAAALRSLLRQDPDIIMIGEIRDQETAEIAIKASLTGHLVLSTLHTNDAPSTITRLLHMGIEPFLITASLSLIQAQRLIRKICPKCKGPDEKVTKEMLLAAELPESWLSSFTPMRGRGCESCGKTGYRGRCGIYEVMFMTEQLREMVIKGTNADQLKAAAIEDGMITLRRAALIKLYRGETTLEEVLNNSRPDGDMHTS